MFGFGKKKNAWKIEYDPTKQKPVIRCSICTGEQTACLQNLQTGALSEIMLIRNADELDAFRTACGVREIEKVY